MTVSPLNSTIAHLTGESTQTWSVSVTRNQAIEYLVDAGRDEDELVDVADSDLVAQLIDSDEACEQLFDMASETDSSSVTWEVDQ